MTAASAVSAKPPDAASARRLLAAAMDSHRRGDLEEAVAGYREALQADPDNFDGLRLLGAALHDLGRFARCLEFLRRALALRPGFAESWRHLASAQFHLGRYDECIGSYETVLRLAGDPQGAVNYWRAMALLELGRNGEFRQSMEQALAYSRQWADRAPAERHAAQCFIGLALLRLGRGEEALQAMEDAIAAAPDWAEAWINRGTILTESLQRHAEAVESFNRALALRPELPDAWFNKGVALERQFRHRDALECFDHTLTLRQDIEAEVHRLSCLNDLGQPQAVVDRADQFLAADASAYKFWFVRGWALIFLGRFDDGLHSMRQGQRLRPSDYKVNMNLAYASLQCGDFDAGWRYYEKRLEGRDASIRRASDGQRWTGDTDLSGRTILLYAEQGLGDTIHFARYVPRVAALGARVTVEAARPLHPLLRSLDAPIELVAYGEWPHGYDFHCPMLSLPLVFGTRIDTIPAQVPYLCAPQHRIDAWRDRLDSSGRQFRIGVACSGNPRFADDARRSMPLARFEPLFGLDCSLHLLQRDLNDEDERFLLACGRIEDYRKELTDFAETAALAECMDLVLSVDTSIAHLAGALGRTVWILLAYRGEWRWLFDREDSPWYPSARIVRQPALGDWAGAIERVRAALEATVSSAPFLRPGRTR